MQFTIRDTGIGMASAIQGNIFKAFSQADTSTTRCFGGTGLGLSICKQLINLMGGEISVQSAPNAGSAFTFTVKLGLPEMPTTLELASQSGLRGMRILIVDDEPRLCQSLARQLGALSFRTEQAHSSEEAFDKLQKAGDDPFRLVLIDWCMPDKKGTDACEYIRNELELAAAPRTILISGYWNAELQQTVETEHIDAFIPKPFSASTLLDNISRLFPKEALSVVEVAKSSNAKNIPDLSAAKILVVEDNQINQEVISGLLAETGCTISLAANGQDALDKVREHHLDLVLMDVHMPVMDGHESTRRIRAWEKATHRARLPIIALTASAMPEDKHMALASGMDEHIAKPADPFELYRSLDKWINKSE